jgi:hypothetical protein
MVQLYIIYITYKIYTIANRNFKIDDNNYNNNYIYYWGVRGRVVKVVDFKPHTPHRCGFESRQGLWITDSSCEGAIQLAYGTSVVLLGCQFVSEIMDGRRPEVFLHQ